MHRPVLVTPPERLPVTVGEIRSYLPDISLGDEAIDVMLRSAVDHLDGWTGILGRCLVEQSWRQDYDSFARTMRLSLEPVISIDQVTWRDIGGEVNEVSDARYSLQIDGGGRCFVRFHDDFALPSDLSSFGAVSIEYRAGYRTLPAEDDAPERSTVPENIRLAIILMVRQMNSMLERDLFETQESVVGVGAIMRSVTPYVAQSVTDTVSNLLSGMRSPRL